MNYLTLQPPFTLKFAQMSKKELKDYFAWFQSIMPTRLEMLIHVVNGTSGFEKWKADFTPHSLDQLGEWFVAEVETRPRTAAEIGEISSRFEYPIEVSSVELTNRTFSIAVDAGMYVAQVFLRNHPSLRWAQPFGSKNFIDYGQPVLDGFGHLSFNPVRIMVNAAYGVVRKTKTGKILREIYDYWANCVRPK